MTRVPILIVLTCLQVALLAASFVGGEGALWVFIVAAGAVPSLLALFGAARRREGDLRASRPLTGGLLGLALWLVGCLASMWLLRGTATVPLVIELIGLCALPLVFVVFLYARTFDLDGVSEGDVAELRRRFPRSEES